MNTFRIMVMVVYFSLSGMGFSIAQHQHGGHGGHSGHGAPGTHVDRNEVVVEGIRVTFQVMSNADHKKMLAEMQSNEELEPGTTHNIAVVLQHEATRKEILDAEMRLKVLSPSDREQVKALRLSKEMKSYDNYFNLPEKGQYELLVAFRTGGKTIKAQAYHTVN